MKKTIKMMCAAAMMLPFASTGAVAEDVEFNAAVSTTCSVVVTRNGTLAVRQGGRVLNSQAAGGTNGLANVTTTSGTFSLAVDQPTAFSINPVTDVTPTQFRGRIRSTGATAFGWTTNTQPLNVGLSRVRVAFRARKAVGNVFPNGTYQGIVVIRCE